MAALRKAIKRHIVMCCAQYDSPSEVARRVHEEFGVVVTRQQIQRYDPSHAAGRTLSTELRTLFDSTRHAFLEEIEVVPASHRAVRIRRLDALADKAREAGLHKLELNALRAIHTEM